MSILSILAAGAAYSVLGGLWFTLLFGRVWAKAVGLQNPQEWKPSPAYYVIPLIGSMVAAGATALLLHLAHAKSVSDALLIGAAVGLGYGAVITTTNAVSPNQPRPGLYALVTGSYHFVGLLLCSAIIYSLSRVAPF